MRHAVAEPAVHRERVLDEPVGRRALGPPAEVLQRLRQVPVVERHHRGDAAGEQAVDQPVVEVEAAGVHRTVGGRDHPGPGDREPVGTHPQVDEQVEVLLPPVVVVAGDVAGVTPQHGSGPPGERVPDRRPPPVLVDGTLDLVGRGGGTPEEPVGEVDRGHGSPSHVQVERCTGRAGRRRPRRQSVEPLASRRRRPRASTITAMMRITPVATFLIAAGCPSRSSPFWTLPTTSAPSRAW